MQTMYDGLVNSPETTTTNNISNSDTIIYLLDPSRVPADLPNLMTLGTGTNAETVKVTAIDGSAITVERGFQGTPAAWNAGTIIARNFTEYDYNALKENILELETDKEELIKDATAKTTPVDADTIPLSDSAASGATKKITWANIKAALETFFDTLYVTLTSVANNLTTTAAGYVLDARQGKVLGDLISTMAADNLKYAEYTLSANQSIPNASSTEVSWSTKTAIGSENFTELNTGKVKILSAGVYDVKITIAFAVNATGARGVYGKVNTAVKCNSILSAASGLGHATTINFLVNANVNDVITASIYQSSGGALDVISDARFTYLQIRKVG